MATTVLFGLEMPPAYATFLVLHTETYSVILHLLLVPFILTNKVPPLKDYCWQVVPSIRDYMATTVLFGLEMPPAYTTFFEACRQSL